MLRVQISPGLAIPTSFTAARLLEATVPTVADPSAAPPSGTMLVAIPKAPFARLTTTRTLFSAVAENAANGTDALILSARARAIWASVSTLPIATTPSVAGRTTVIVPTGSPATATTAVPRL